MQKPFDSEDTTEHLADSKGSSLERMLRILDLFTEHHPIWTVDGMGNALGFTRSTAYRYVRELAEANLLFQVEAGRYALGARIITWDRQLRVSDPLVRAAHSWSRPFRNGVPSKPGWCVGCSRIKWSVSIKPATFPTK